MSQEKVEYVSISKGANDKAIVSIGNAVMIVADKAKITEAGDLKLYEDNSVVAAIETLEPAHSVPNGLRRVIQYDEEFEWVV